MTHAAQVVQRCLGHYTTAVGGNATTERAAAASDGPLVPLLVALGLCLPFVAAILGTLYLQSDVPERAHAPVLLRTAAIGVLVWAAAFVLAS